MLPTERREVTRFVVGPSSERAEGRFQAAHLISTDDSLGTRMGTNSCWVLHLSPRSYGTVSESGIGGGLQSPLRRFESDRCLSGA